MLKRRTCILFLLLFSGLFSLRGSHLVGGEITYQCVGNNNYEITLTIYRDCFSSTGFDRNIVVSIYDINNNLVDNLLVPILSQSNLPVIAPNNCTTLPATVCTQKALYKTTINLPPIPGGYTITHQRCCRNSTITNVFNNPTKWGSTYTTRIPSNDVGCNSSPSFQDDPPVVLCLNQMIQLDLSASESDGDSLYYELCTPLHGGGPSINSRGPNSPMPDTATPPPYQLVPFVPGFTSILPITSNPPFQIDPHTGILSGMPTQIGQFVFSICVSEFRNGVFINKISRDFQFNISGDCRTPTSVIVDQTIDPSSLCSGKTINFSESCLFTNDYYWDFGDPTTNADTSRLASPSYVYSDTGVYNVMLIANPYTPCADTSYSLFRVFDPVEISFDYTGLNCFESHSLNFTSSGVYGDSAVVSWDFGGLTNQGTTLTGVKNPENVRFLQPGTYNVKVTVIDYECNDSYSRDIRLIGKPELIHKVPEVRECAPVVVSFRDSSEAEAPMSHFWNFGDGSISDEKNPVHIYTKPGIYTVYHSVSINESGCIATVTDTFHEVIEALPVPVSQIKVSPEITEYPQTRFTVTNASDKHLRTITYLPFGSPVEDLNSMDFKLDDTGSYKITHITYNQFGCTDTMIQKIRVEAPVKIFIPNAFTPNNDGINDLLAFSVLGVKEFDLTIFDRWGSLVFTTTSTDYLWNGKLLNTGTELNTAVYSYVINATVIKTNEVISQRGTITLIR